MRVSFDIDYSSLWRSGEPVRRFRLPLPRAPDLEGLRIYQVADSSRIALPDPSANTWYLHAPAIAAGGRPSSALAP